MTDVIEDSVCVGCGLGAVVRVEDQCLCGNCYYVSLTLREGLRTRAVGSEKAGREQDLERTILAAVEEIRRLRQRVDDLVHASQSPARDSNGDRTANH